MTKMYSNKLDLIYGATNKTKVKRQKDDYYATEPKAIYLAKQMFKETSLSKRVWECACGEGHISKSLIDLGYNVKSSDIIDRGYGKVIDFLKYNKQVNADIVTNPPFKQVEDFIVKAMEILQNKKKLYLFCKIQILEGKKRQKIFQKYKPKYVYVYSERVGCAMNGDFEKYNAKTFCYCWLIFEKGFNDETALRWI